MSCHPAVDRFSLCPTSWKLKSKQHPQRREQRVKQRMRERKRDQMKQRTKQRVNKVDPATVRFNRRIVVFPNRHSLRDSCVFALGVRLCGSRLPKGGALFRELAIIRDAFERLFPKQCQQTCQIHVERDAAQQIVFEVLLTIQAQPGTATHSQAQPRTARHSQAGMDKPSLTLLAPLGRRG